MTHDARFTGQPWRFLGPTPGNAWPVLPDAAASAVLALLLQLERSQWLAPAELEAEQSRQLDLVTRHAWNTVPHYRAAWEGCYDPSQPMSRERLAALPVLSRRELQGRYQELKSRAAPPEHGGVVETRTSGSSGTPVRTLTSGVTGAMWKAITLRDHAWRRRNLAGKLAVIRRGHGGVAASWGAATAGLLSTGQCVARDVDASQDAHLDWLAREQPAYLLTYPSLVVELARASLRRGLRLPGLLEVRTLGESLGPDVRALCRDAWDVPLADFYSAEEVGYIALQCPDYEHYHVQAENVVVEIIDQRGAPCPPGEVGRVVITTLHNFAMPLVRYEIGDYASFGTPCSCGRGLPVLERIAGRVNSMLVTSSGDRYWPVFRMRQAQDLMAIRQHQFVQKRFDLVEARLVVDRRPTAEQEEELLRHMAQLMPQGIRLQIVYCDALPRTAGGKWQDFISEVA